MPSRAPHDFLLEASERISRASIIDTGTDGWPEEDLQPSRLIRPIRFRRRAGLEGALLTRTYSGRSHIPGEDSGSEIDDDDEITTSEQNRLLSSDRSIPHLPSSNTNVSHPSLYETTSADLPTQIVSVPTANLQEQSIDSRASRQSHLRQRLQNYNSNHIRRADDELMVAHSRDQDGLVSGPSYGNNTSRTPIRARRAPPRPHFAHSMEETINRAAVFERRLERALREYRTARRAWSTLSNSHMNLGENGTHAWTTTPTSTTAQATTTLTENEGTEHNSVHDILRSVRMEQPSIGALATLNTHTQREIGRPLESSDPATQYDTPWRRRDSESRSHYGAPGPDGSSSANGPLIYDRLLRDLQLHRARFQTNAHIPVPHYSRSNQRNYADSQGDRLHHSAQRAGYGISPPLTSGSFSDSLGDSHLSNDYDLLYRRTTPARAYALPGLETGDASQRRDFYESRSARLRSDHRSAQQPKAVLKFLARLREDPLTREQAWDLATTLGIHNQNLEQDSQTDLVMSINEMPEVEYTSWLEPGVVWTGSQYADTARDSRAPSMIQDQLTVKVVLHSVDWDKMTLTGTMAANQHQRKTSTESFFTGEIVDFRKHGLDTYCTRRPRRYTSFNVNHSDPSQWASGDTYQDLEMDLLHWPMLGPFKRDIDRALAIRQSESQQDKRCCDSDRSHCTSQNTDTQDHTGEQANRNEDPRFKPSLKLERESAPYSGLTTDEIASVRLNKMGRVLSSAQWLQSNLNQAGWILMRWKEQCFMPSTRNQSGESEVSLSQDIESSDRRRPTSQQLWTTVQSERESLNTMTIPPNESNEATTRNDVWALSIDGFYYVAMNRQTGEIEALYHDPGSALYQKLEMKPIPSVGDLGVRTSFSLVEFR